MAIVKKGKKVDAPGYPETFVRMVDRAAALQVAKGSLEEAYDSAREEIETYLTSDDCPVTINVGEKGSNPKVEGIATVIVSQPERLDNKAAAQTVAQMVADGKINAADLVELISTVNKDALSKVLDAATMAGLVKKDESGEVALQISIRANGDFKSEVGAYVDAEILPRLNTRKAA